MEENNNENITDTTEGSAEEKTVEKDILRKAKRKARIQGMIIGIVLTFAVMTGLCGYLISRSYYNYYDRFISVVSKKEDLLGQLNYNKINHLYEIINTTFLFDHEKQAVIDGMYKGMFDALDDVYSTYYTKEEYEEMNESSSGTFEGIGAYLQVDEDNECIKVVRPMKNSPAEKAGVMNDDLIIEVDGENVQITDIDYVVSKIRGPKGTTVHIKFKRGSEYVEYDIERNKINEDSVTSEVMDDEIGYIYITSFDDDTDVEFKSHIDDLLNQNITSLIIDLRSNGGGYVDTAVGVADRILDKGEIVTIEYRNGQNFKYSSDSENKLDMPIVVITDGNTASASEILTGALRDYGVATIVGTKTFGKGIVQDVIDLDDGSGIKITTAQYFTPKGECIHKVGIEPDVSIELDIDEYRTNHIDNQLEKAKEILKNKK